MLAPWCACKASSWPLVPVHSSRPHIQRLLACMRGAPGRKVGAGARACMRSVCECSPCVLAPRLQADARGCRQAKRNVSWSGVHRPKYELWQVWWCVLMCAKACVSCVCSVCVCVCLVLVAVRPMQLCPPVHWVCPTQLPREQALSLRVSRRVPHMPHSHSYAPPQLICPTATHMPHRHSYALLPL